MTWTALIILALGTYAMRSSGPLILGKRPLPPRAALIVALLPAALLAALVMVQTAQGSDGPIIDARLGALVAAAVALALRAPFLVVVIASVITAAALRLVL